MGILDGMRGAFSSVFQSTDSPKAETPASHDTFDVSDTLRNIKTLTGTASSPATHSQLAGYLGSSNHQVRLAALNILRQAAEDTLKNPETVGKTLSCLNDSNPEVHSAAMDALAKVPHKNLAEAMEQVRDRQILNNIIENPGLSSVIHQAAADQLQRLDNETSMF